MRSRATLPAQPRLPLVVTGDGDLLDELLRLAAAGGAEVDVAADPTAARSRYARAPLVLLGADLAAACLRARLPRRSGVAIVAPAGRPGIDGPANGEVAPPEALWRVAEQLGAEHVAVLPAAESWLVQRLTERGRLGPDHAPTVAVIGGRGGAGASVLAVGLAVTAARRGRRTLLVDADPLGGGIDVVLGWEDVDGLRWPALSEADGRLDAPALLGALPARGELAAISWDRGEWLDLPPLAMAATIEAGRRARDLVVVDLPRQLGDAGALALQAADRALLVVPAELRATAAAARLAAIVVEHCSALSVVVRGPSPGRLTARDVVASLGLPLAGTLRPEPALSRSLERGEAPASSGRGPLAGLCEQLVGELVGDGAAASA